MYCIPSDFSKTEHCSSDVREKRKERRLDVVKLLVMLLPLEKKKALKMVLGLLNDVAAESEVNKMDAVNLATIFTPCILIPNEVLPFLKQNIHCSI